jgi:hypothetical protein
VLLGTSWGKTWELGETLWEHIGNKEKNKKNFSFLPKGKNWTRHEGMLNFFIGYMKLLFSKLLVTIFSLG